MSSYEQFAQHDICSVFQDLGSFSSVSCFKIWGSFSAIPPFRLLGWPYRSRSDTVMACVNFNTQVILVTLSLFQFCFFFQDETTWTTRVLACLIFIIVRKLSIQLSVKNLHGHGTNLRLKHEMCRTQRPFILTTLLTLTTIIFCIDLLF